MEDGDIANAFDGGRSSGGGDGCLDRPVGVSTPTVTALVVIKANTTTVSKIDLLFMIDNSPSMADKQKFLEKAVPDLMKRLVDPVCVDSNDNDAPDDKKPDPVTGQCPTPYQRDFEPVRDIHVGDLFVARWPWGAARLRRRRRHAHRSP